MTVRVTGTTFENRQERLQFLKRFPVEDLSVTLERGPNNQYDKNAIQVIVHIKPIAKKDGYRLHTKRIGKRTF